MKPYRSCRTDDERRAYARGYSAGRCGKWPRELADTVPDQFVANLLNAATELSGSADAFMAGFDDRDEDPDMRDLDAARDRLHDTVTALLASVTLTPEDRADSAGGVNEHNPEKT